MAEVTVELAQPSSQHNAQKCTDCIVSNGSSVINLHAMSTSSTIASATSRQDKTSLTSSPNLLAGQRLLAPGESQGTAADPQQPRMPPQTYLCIAILAVIVFVVEFGSTLANVPSTKVTKDIICRKCLRMGPDPNGVFSAPPLDESLCQAAAVQAELNVVSTGLLILGYVPGLLVAFFFGTLSDTWGRRPAFGLCGVGMVLANVLLLLLCWTWEHGSIRIVWTSSLALFLGGGPSVAEAIVFTMISDLTTEQNRATVFQIITSAVLLAETLAPIVANALMAQSIWLPLIVSPAVVLSGTGLLAFYPETAPARHRTENAEQHDRASTQRTAGRWPAVVASRAGEAVQLFAQTRAIGFLTPAAALPIPLTTVALSLATRYISVRFGWPLSALGILPGAETGLSLLVLVCLVPLAAAGLRRLRRRRQLRRRQGRNDHERFDATPPNQTARRRDNLRLAQASSVLAAAGMALFSAAPTVATAVAGLTVLALGSGVPSLCRAVVSGIVPRAHLGRVFTFLTMLEMATYVAGGLGLAALFQASLHAKAAAALQTTPTQEQPALTYPAAALLALPFYCATLLSVLISAALWCVQLPSPSTNAKQPQPVGEANA